MAFSTVGKYPFIDFQGTDHFLQGAIWRERFFILGLWGGAIYRQGLRKGPFIFRDLGSKQKRKLVLNLKT